MTERIASLPMYDIDRAAVEAGWRGIASAMRAQGLSGVPASLDWPDDLGAHWRDSRLLLSQTCGYPLMTTLSATVQVVGAFRYTAPGCAGIHYRSDLIVRSDDDGESLEDFRGRGAVVNSLASHSGSNALRGLVAPLALGAAFFSRWSVSGSHRASLAAVRSRSADIAAIDCVTLAAFRRSAPGLLSGLRVIASTATAPGLPLVTAARTSLAELRAVRNALISACDDPELAAVREALFIGGFEVVEVSAWQLVEDVRRAAASTFWPDSVRG